MSTNTESFKKRMELLLPELIAFRRDLHAHPEVGFQEHRTAFDFNDEAIGTAVSLHCAVAWSWAK